MTDEERFWSKVDRSAGPDNCWLWTAALNNKGYGKFWGGERLVYAHRYVLGLTGIGSVAGPIVMHHCDTPACVNPAHLAVATQKDNIQDCMAKGRKGCARLPGEANPNAKLTDADVHLIRWLADDGQSRKLIQEAFNISKQLVSVIVQRKAWAHV